MTKTKKQAAKATSERGVIVTTEHRGVFFGYARDIDGETITLRRMRNCVYWSADVRGFVGLAVTGPTASCRVGPPVERATVRAITCVLECSPEACTAWERQPWA